MQWVPRIPNVKAIYSIYFMLEISVAFDFAVFQIFSLRFFIIGLTYSFTKFTNDNERYVMHDDFTKRKLV